jgi:hypothetical protein
MFNGLRHRSPVSILHILSNKELLPPPPKKKKLCQKLHRLFCVKELQTVFCVESFKDYFVSNASKTILCRKLQRLFCVESFKDLLYQKLLRPFCVKSFKDYFVSKAPKTVLFEKLQIMVGQKLSKLISGKFFLFILCAGEQLLPDAPRVQGYPVPGRTLSRRPALASGGGFFMDQRVIKRCSLSWLTNSVLE